MQGSRLAGPRAARGGPVCRMPAAQGKQAVETGRPKAPTSAPRPSCPLLTPAGGHRCPESSPSRSVWKLLLPKSKSWDIPGAAASRSVTAPPRAPQPPAAGLDVPWGLLRPEEAAAEEGLPGQPALRRRLLEKPWGVGSLGRGQPPEGLGGPSEPAGRAPAWAGPPARGRRPGRRCGPSGARPARGPRAAAPSAGPRAGRSPPGPRSGSGRTGGL